MNKTKLTLGEIFALEAELAGITNQQTGEKTLKGLLNQSISLLQKYWITDLVEDLGKHKKNIDKIRNEMIEKYGEKKDDNTITIPVKITKKNEDGTDFLNDEGKTVEVINPNFQMFNEEMEKLFAEEREIEHYPFKLEDFNITTDESYSVFFKLIKKNSNKEAEQPV